jgi:hypothetical protein
LRKVEEFKGNTTKELWAMMGNVVNAQGVERHGQSCFLYVYPNGTPEVTAKFIDADVADSDVLVDDGDGAHGPIAEVAQLILDNYIQMKNFVPSQFQDDDPPASVLEYDGYRVGAGWIYGALLVAQSHGCTQATIGISSNDGNIYMEAWDRTLGAYVTAVHITYYGT